MKITEAEFEALRDQIYHALNTLQEHGVRDAVMLWSVDVEGEGIRSVRHGIGSTWAQNGMIHGQVHADQAHQVAVALGELAADAEEEDDDDDVDHGPEDPAVPSS